MSDIAGQTKVYTADCEWKTYAKATKDNDHIAICAHCDRPAIYIDHLWPYHAEMNKCNEHRRVVETMISPIQFTHHHETPQEELNRLERKIEEFRKWLEENNVILCLYDMDFDSLSKFEELFPEEVREG